MLNNFHLDVSGQNHYKFYSVLTNKTACLLYTESRFCPASLIIRLSLLYQHYGCRLCDGQNTSSTFGQLSKIVANYDGFIEKQASDSVMAIFEVPKANEDDPIPAIKVDSKIHQAVDIIRLRPKAVIASPCDRPGHSYWLIKPHIKPINLYIIEGGFHEIF